MLLDALTAGRRKLPKRNEAVHVFSDSWFLIRKWWLVCNNESVISAVSESLLITVRHGEFYLYCSKLESIYKRR